MEVRWDLSASLSLRHNVGWNDVWCRKSCDAGGSRPCHVLMVKTMVKVARRCSKRVASQQDGT